jgi:trimeric autotransporter adhesin
VIGGGTAAAGTFTTATATTGNITNVNATTVDSTNLEVTNIKAKDGTAAATIADSTGVVTIPSAVLTTADINGGTVDNAAVGAGTPSTGAFTTLSSNSTTTLNGTTIPASKTLLVSTDIGSTVQGYDADTAKYDDVTANFTGTLQNGGSNVLVDTDIGTNVQAYDAQLADVAGLTPADGAFIVGDGANFVAESGATARTSLGLGSIATQAANSVDIDGGAVDGVTLGTNSAVTEAQIDNVNINGNAIVSSDTDGDLSLTPNGTGDLILDGLKWPQADGTADYVLKTDGSGQLSWTEQTGGGGTPGGSDTQIQYNSGGSFAGASGLVTDGSNLTLNAQGDLRFADSDSSNWVAFQAPATVASNVTWTLPDADGTDGQVIKTNGSGTLSWITPSAGGGGGGTSVTVTQATATASQTTFNVTYTVGQLSVYLNGALLASADYTATNGTTVVLAAGAASGDIFTAVAYSTVAGLEIESGSPFMTAVGSGAGAVNTGVRNVFVGFEAGNDNTTGANNTAVGYQALDANTTGIRNTAVGSSALTSSIAAQYNTAIGYNALSSNETGGFNTSVGDASLEKNTTGVRNTAVGQGALNANTTGTDNTAVGKSALDVSTTASDLTAIGRDAGGANTTGSDNTFVGANAGANNTTGISNTFVGRNCSGSSAGANNQVVLGANISSQGQGYVTIGVFAEGKIYNQFGVNATWTQTSDERLKKNIQDDTLGLSFVNRLRPVKYQWKPSNEIDPSLPYYNEVNQRNTEAVMHGLVAQEVKAALDAEGVSTFAGWDMGEDTIQAISREMFVSPLIKAIQELSAKCDSLQAEINTLKGQ